MTSPKDRAWRIMGEIAVELRGLVGGGASSPFGPAPSSTLRELAARVDLLRVLLDKYDRAILDAMNDDAEGNSHS